MGDEPSNTQEFPCRRTVPPMLPGRALHSTISIHEIDSRKGEVGGVERKGRTADSRRPTSCVDRSHALEPAQAQSRLSPSA